MSAGPWGGAGWAPDPGALAAADPEVASLVAAEARRQDQHLELIASENCASDAVMAATGSVLTNKYAEGPVGRRYYGGCTHVDAVEALAQARAQQLFGAEYANLQPHSGSQANLAVMATALQLGDVLMGMELSAGGHLTHGAPANLSGRLYRAVHYGVDRETGRLDMEAIAAMARQHRPKMLIAGASAYPRQIDFAAFGRIAQEVGAVLLADIAHLAGLVAAGEHPSPVPHADFVTSTTHKTLRGPRGGIILARAAHARRLDASMCPRTQGGPLMHVVAAKAVALAEARGPSFVAYQRRVRANARALAEALIGHGLRLCTGGTDNHLVLIDLRPAGLTGREAEARLGRAGITVNKNAIPFDPQKPLVTSGIRLGTPQLTTRGMGPAEMHQVAALVVEALAAGDSEARLGEVRRRAGALTQAHPLFGPRGWALRGAAAPG